MCAGALGAQAVKLPPPPSGADPVLSHISAASLRGHLSFIASDLLEGRGTPSRGLDLAAEYIAAQFRRTGLEPAGDDGYYQTAKMLEVEPATSGFELRVVHGERTFQISHTEVTSRLQRALDLTDAPVFKLAPDAQGLANLKPEDVAGKVLLADLPAYATVPRKIRKLFQTVERVHPALTIILTTRTPAEIGAKLVDPEKRSNDGPERLVVHNAELLKWAAALPAGATGATLTLRLPAPVETPVTLKNVIGVLRGSDPVLKDSYILVTAHYDHLGTKTGGNGDRIYNGANDDGSGTVSVVELAAALAKLAPRPKRSIVFMTFFGEEEGVFGSQYYAAHPIFPLARTIANVNLEQVGRTDSTEGPKLSQVTFTGYPYSNLPEIFRTAGETIGVRVLSDERYGDSFFDRSDNISFANVGIPAHTLAVVFDFADYHAVGDEWQKIDYDNMAKVDRMLALGILALARNPEPPKWNVTNPKVENYLKAWKELHPAKP